MNRHEARLCLGLTLLLGLLYAALNPPFAPSHELEQFARASELARGHWAPRRDAQGFADWLPLLPDEALDAYRRLPLDENARLDTSAWQRDLDAQPSAATRVAAALSTQQAWPLLSHVPGLWFAQRCGLAALWQLYLARLCGLVCYALLAALAISRAGRLRLLFFVLALTPAAVTDAASVTGASLPYALSLLLAALCLHGLASEEAAPTSGPRLAAACTALGIALLVLGAALDPRPLVPAPDTLGTRLIWPFTHPLEALRLVRGTLFRRADEAWLQLLASEAQLAHQLRLAGVMISVLFTQLLLGLGCGALRGSMPPERTRKLARVSLLVALTWGACVCASLFLAEDRLAPPILERFEGAPFRPLLPWLTLALAATTRPIAARWLGRKPRTRVVLPILVLHAYALFALYGRFYATSLPFPT